jgi:tetratricopeptide (TPR) repeat protein
LSEQHEALAHHYYQGEEWEKACEYATMVARRAASLHAPRATIEHATRAIDAAMKCDPDCCPEAVSPDLYRMRGQAYEAVGEFDRSREDHEAAIASARERGDLNAEWQAHIDLGMLWAGRDYSRTGEYCQQAYELARLTGDERLLAHSLNRLANWRLNTDQQPIEALQQHDEALAMFERLDDRRGVAETLDYLGVGNLLVCDIETALRRAEAAAALYREFDMRQGLSSVLACTALCGPSIGSTHLAPVISDVSVGEAHVQEALRIARDIDRRDGESFALVTFAEIRLGVGDFGAALLAAREGLRVAQEIGHVQWMTAAHWVIGLVYRSASNHEAALRELLAARDHATSVRSGHWMRTCAAMIAQTYTAQGRYGEARAEIEASSTGIDAPRSWAQRDIWLARTELQVAEGDPSGALRSIELLDTGARQAGAREMSALLHWHRAQASLALGRLDAAEGDLRQAIELARKCQLRLVLWPALAALGEHRQSQGREDEARAAFDEAFRTIEEMAATLAPEDDAVRFTFLNCEAVQRVRSALGTRSSL